MRQTPPTPTFGKRVLILLLNTLALLLIAKWLRGEWVLPKNSSGAWFWAVLGMWIVQLVVAPFFTAPKNVIATALPALMSLPLMDLTECRSSSDLEVVRIGAFCLISVAILSAVLTTWLYDPAAPVTDSTRVHVGNLNYALACRIGDPRVIYAPIAFISVVGFATTASEGVRLAVVATVAFANPLLFLFGFYQDYRDRVAGAVGTVGLGVVERIDEPNVVRVRLDDVASWKARTIHGTVLASGDRRLILPLYTQVQGGAVIGTGLVTPADEDAAWHVASGRVIALSDYPRPRVEAELGATPEQGLVGLVVENSSIATLRIEVRTDAEVSDGMVLRTSAGGVDVYYQVVNIRTHEEVFGGNPRGALIAEAGQVGAWQDGRFVKCGHVPAMNTPVFDCRQLNLRAAEKTDEPHVRLGMLAGTQVPIEARLHDLVDHHTAILGATGTGKTELAFDLIEAASTSGVKVICVDFTGDYFDRLQPHSPVRLTLPESSYAKLAAAIEAVETGKFAAGDEKKALQELIELGKPWVRQKAAEFLEGNDGLAVFELPDIANTPATLRATELYMSSVFAWARQNRERGQRVLLVLEEAHTIVPEFNFYRDRSDTQAVVGRTAQIALQGRKYGVGLLVISQRTALVSKSVLTQCNTVVCFRLHDATSLGFLSNVFSQEHVHAIPNLGFLEALVAGKALMAEKPIQLRVPTKTFDPDPPPEG